MAILNLLVDDEGDDPTELLAKAAAAALNTEAKKSAPVASAAVKPAAKLSTRPAPRAQTVRYRGGGYGTRPGGEEGAQDRERGLRPPYQGGRRGGYQGEFGDDSERPPRSSTVLVHEVKRECTGRGNWGTTSDELLTQETEALKLHEKALVPEKQGAQQDAPQAEESKVSKNSAANEVKEDKEITFEEFEKVMEKQKALLALKKSDERKVRIDEHLLCATNNKAALQFLLGGVDDVVRLLHYLSCAKYKILSKELGGQIKITLPPVDEKEIVIDDDVKDMGYQIDALLVRILKSREVMAHIQLVAECVEQLSRMFKVSAQLVDAVTQLVAECVEQLSRMFKVSACGSPAISMVHRETTKGERTTRKDSVARQALKPQGRGRNLAKDILLNVGRNLPVNYLMKMKMTCRSWGDQLQIVGGASLVLSCPTSLRVFFLKIGVTGGIPVLEDADYLHPPPSGSYLCWGSSNGLMGMQNSQINFTYLHCPMCSYQRDLPIVPGNMIPKGVFFRHGSFPLVIMELLSEENMVNSRVVYMQVYDDDSEVLDEDEPQEVEAEGTDQDVNEDEINLSWATYPGAEDFTMMQSLSFNDSVSFIGVAGNAHVIVKYTASQTALDSDNENEEDAERIVELELVTTDHDFTIWPRNGLHVFCCDQDVYVCCIGRNSEGTLRTRLFRLQTLVNQEYELVPANNVGPFSVFLGANQAVVLPSAELSVGLKPNTIYIEHLLGENRAFQIVAVNLETQALTFIPFPEDVVPFLTDSTPAVWVAPLCGHCKVEDSTAGKS